MSGAFGPGDLAFLGAVGASSGIALPAIGDAFGGGFYAGLISHTANGNPTHALIVAPRATGYATSGLAWKTTATATANTASPFDGAANTAAIVAAGIAAHPAAQFCVNLSIGGFTDWYLPATAELDIAYENFKPTTLANAIGWGVNNYSVPRRTANRTTGIPAQTSVTAFQSTGAEAFIEAAHWTSTDTSAALVNRVSFVDGSQVAGSNLNVVRLRAFRRIAL